MLIKNSIIYISGEVLAKIFPIFLMPYLTRKLGVIGYGELVYYLSIVNLVGILVGFSMHAAVSRYYFRYGRRSIGLPVSAALIFSASASFICTVLMSLLNVKFSWLLASYAFFNALFSIVLSILQCQKKATHYILLQLANILFSTILTILLIELYGGRVSYRLIAMVAVMAIFAIVALLSQKVRFFWPLKLLVISTKYLIVFGIPLLLHAACNFIRFDVDKIILSDVMSQQDFGVYALAAKVGALVQIFLLAINKAMQPIIYSALKDGSGKSLLMQLQKGLFVLSIMVILVFYCVPEFLYLEIFGVDYVGTKSLAFLFAVGYIFLAPYFAYVNVAFYFGWRKLIAKVSLYSTGVYFVVFSIFFVNDTYHLIPTSLALSSIVMSVFIYISVYNKFLKNDSSKKI